MQIRRRVTTTEPARYCEVAIASPVEVSRTRLSHVLAADHTLVTATASCEGLLDLAYALDVVVLDARSPDHRGFQTYRRIRARWRSSIIVVVGAASDVAATEMLSSGADDAITDDTSWEYAVARLKAATRRARAYNASLRLRVGDIIYSREDRRVWCGSEEVRLTPREMDVFDCLWRHAGNVVSHDQIHDYAWRTSKAIARVRQNRVEVYVSSLRRRLMTSATVQIDTIRRSGYQLTLRTNQTADEGM